MNANDVIESYVRDVASCLPRNKRNDVAFELRALLTDELAGKAEAEGRAPDKAMAMALLKDFGRPAEAASRYHERPAIIDPADTHHFVIWTLGGAVSIGVLSLLGDPGDDLFLKWLGVLVIFFALAGWLRRRKPGAFNWKPRRGPDETKRWVALLEAGATLIFPVFMYAAPRTFAEVAFLGVIPTSGLEITEAFARSPQRAVTLGMLVLTVAIYLAVAVQGRWRPWTRWTSIVSAACLAGLFLMHAAPMTLSPGGAPFEVFTLARANATASPIFGALGALYLLILLYELYREWSRIRPAPKLKAQLAR